MNEESVDQASDEYERAEQAYLAALASGSEDSALRFLAEQVAGAASEWESVDNAVPPPVGIARYYDAPETLATLWRDLADAYSQRLS